MTNGRQKEDKSGSVRSQPSAARKEIGEDKERQVGDKRKTSLAARRPRHYELANKWVTIGGHMGDK